MWAMLSGVCMQVVSCAVLQRLSDVMHLDRIVDKSAEEVTEVLYVLTHTHIYAYIDASVDVVWFVSGRGWLRTQSCHFLFHGFNQSCKY